jgi:sulfate/thiosulfate transport system ATP-binding protein
VSIELTDITKTFGGFVALRHVSLTVPDGELVALLGPSGSGKTTLLRVIAGLEQPDAGSGPIRFHDEDVARQRAGDRRVGFVFQHYALFRHMSVFENVAFGLRVRPRAVRPAETTIRAKVGELLRLVQLDGLVASSRAGSGSGSRWPALSPSSRGSSCSMSRLARSMRRCAKNCVAGCAGCTTSCTCPACSLPTIRTKHSRSPTG